MDPSQVSHEQLKQQASQIGSMSDAQLKAAAEQAASFNPMLRNMDPNMMRQASAMMQNMSPEQIANMQKMASSMMGGGMPNTPQQQRPSQTPPTLSAPDKKDFDRAETLKNEAAKLVSQKDLEGACLKYFAAINIIRLNDSLKSKPEGKSLEMACRANVAHCKLQQKEFDQVIDQCEKVLEHEPNNAKCQFRMATAIWSISKTKSDTQIKSAFKNIKLALQSLPNDKAIKALYDEIKIHFDQIQAQHEESKEPPKTTAEKVMSRVKIDEPVIEEVKTPEAPPQQQQPPQQQFQGDMRQNIDMINQMPEDQLANMVNMMKQNPQLIRQQYETLHNVKLSDSQLEQIMANMTPDTIRQGTNLAKSDPSILRKAQELQQRQNQGPQSQQTQLEQPQPQAQIPTGIPDMSNMAEMMNNPMVKEMMNNPEMMKMAQQMMGGMGGAQDPGKMQEMMKNPSLTGLLENPDFLSTSLNMLKSPMAKPQLDAISQQTGMSQDTILRGLEWLISLSRIYSRVRPVLPVVKYGVILLVVALVLRWLGYL